MYIFIHFSNGYLSEKSLGPPYRSASTVSPWGSHIWNVLGRLMSEKKWVVFVTFLDMGRHGINTLRGKGEELSGYTVHGIHIGSCIL